MLQIGECVDVMPFPKPTDKIVCHFQFLHRLGKNRVCTPWNILEYSGKESFSSKSKKVISSVCGRSNYCMAVSERIEGLKNIRYRKVRRIAADHDYPII